MTAASKTWTTARLIPPTTDGFLVVAAASGRWRLPLALPSRARRQALARLSDLARSLSHHSGFREATVLRGLIRPPGNRSLPGQWQGPAAFDAVLLIRTADVDTAERILRSESVTGALAILPRSIALSGSNVRRIADVDHSRPGVYLMNWFTADSVEANLDAWQHTAGWFQAETGLDNSTVIRPEAGDESFALVNHCRWDSLRSVLPSLVFKRSFHRFVLETFRAHRVAPHPVLYRLHRSRSNHKTPPSGS